MFFWNRKELLTTFNSAQSGAVCEALKDAGIAYDVTASANGNYSENTHYQYRIFVHRKDFYKAECLIRNISY